MLGGHASAAEAALERLAAESGRLQVLDWAGYGYDGGQAMFARYDKKYPKNKPKFTVMANEADALGKLQQGVNWDIFRPYVGWVRYFAESGLAQPWDTSLIPNFKRLNPLMVKAGQYKGKQYGIPEDWGGFDAVPRPVGQGETEGALLGPSVRRALQGQDRLVRRRQHACSR